MYLKKKMRSFFTALLILTVAGVFALGGTGADSKKSTEESQQIRLPIIMYHSILKDEKLGNDYTITPKLFEDDLKYLKKNGYTAVTVSDLVSYVYSDGSLGEKIIMLSFDDGYYNNYHYAFPLLKKYGFRAVISPIASMTERFSKTSDISVTYGHISDENIKEMVSSGLVEIQNHSYDMHSLRPRRGVSKKSGESIESYRQAITSDITKAQNYLKSVSGTAPRAFVYPFGAYDEDTQNIVKEMGFACTLTCTEKPNFISKSPDSLYDLGRYRRDRSQTMEQLIKKIEKDIG